MIHWMKLKVDFCQKIQFGSNKFTESLSWAEIELSDKNIHLVSSNESFLLTGTSNFLLRISSDLAHFFWARSSLTTKSYNLSAIHMSLIQISQIRLHRNQYTETCFQISLQWKTLTGLCCFGSIMNCRACLPNKQAFHCWGSNSNVLWVTCSSSHKHESCTLRFHIRTKTAALTYTHAQPHKKIVPCFPFTRMLLDITLCTVHTAFFLKFRWCFCVIIYKEVK